MKRDAAGITRLDIITRHAMRKALRAFGLVTVRERENDFILESLQQISQEDKQGPLKVMDIGSASSLLPLRLARLGYRVTALDIRPYPFDHRNLTFIQANITDSGFRSDVEFQDVVVCVSTLEHIGIGYYGDKMALEGDKLALEAMHEIIKPGGGLLLTVPFAGQFRRDDYQRIYDPEVIGVLFSTGWRLRREIYFVPKGTRNWVPAPKTDAIMRHEAYPESNNACFWFEAVHTN
jgi:2-polyprenyl-3-methyl-5-hydroxy-6-metoxy-1,4-benzoquinol methylase